MGDNVGKYQLIAQIGEVFPHRVNVAACKGSGNSKQLVLVRYPLPGVLGGPDERLRLLTTVRNLKRANHNNLAIVYDVEGDPYSLSFVSEYLAGQNFALLLEASRAIRNAFPHTLLLRMVLDVLSALEYLHQLRGPAGEFLSIVHGGIHPRNIVVTYDGVTKVVGLESAGIRVDLRREGSADPNAPFYAAPEQLTSRTITNRTDIFAVGALIWEIIARGPLLKGTQEVVKQKFESGSLPNINSIVRGVPEMLQNILDRSLRINPQERYASAKEMQNDIESYLASTGKTISQNQIAERMRTVFAQEAEHARRCAIAWIDEAIRLDDPDELEEVDDVDEVDDLDVVDSGEHAPTAGSMGPGGWLGASAVKPPSLSPSSVPPPASAINYADLEAARVASRSLILSSSANYVEPISPRRWSRLLVGAAIGAVLAFVAVGVVLASGIVLRWSGVQLQPAPAVMPANTADSTNANSNLGTEPNLIKPPKVVQPPPPEPVQSATVRLDSDPSDAEVEWQGKVVGHTPMQLTVPLGLQVFTLSLDDYRRKDVAIDTAVATGPDGFYTLVELELKKKATSSSRSKTRTARTPRRLTPPKKPIPVNASTPIIPSEPSTAVTPTTPEPEPVVPVKPPPKKIKPKIRTITADSPTIKTIDEEESGKKPKVKVLGND
ncbi:MAG: protein kinase [Deltaproteobacteria bacterium]|nr:protein kinase [Deltaproteobacteria bacterium]